MTAHPHSAGSRPRSSPIAGRSARTGFPPARAIGWIASAGRRAGLFGQGRPRTLGSVLSAASFGLLLIVALGAPLALGSDDPLPCTLWCLMLAASLALADPATLSPAHLRLLLPATAIGAALLLTLGMQAGFGPAMPAAIWTDTAALLGVPPRTLAAVDAGMLAFSIAPPLALLLALVAGIVTGAEAERARRLSAAISYAGLAYAAIGMIQLLIDPGSVLWIEKRAYVGNLTTPFINRNTAGTFYGTCCIIWHVRALDEAKRLIRKPAGGLSGVMDALILNAPRLLVARALAVLMLLGAVFMTGSRAASLLTAVALLIASFLSLRRRLPGRAGFLLIVGVVGLTGLLLMQLLGGAVSARIDRLGLADAGRFQTYKTTIEIIRDHPWWGVGLGSYAQIYPEYRSPAISSWGRWDRAHDTLLETAAELGLVFTLLLVASGTVYAVRLVTSSLRRHAGARHTITATAIGFLGIGHSLVDFSLQVPGYAIVFALLVGCGLAQTAPQAAPRSRPVRRPATAGVLPEPEAQVLESIKIPNSS